MMRPAKKQKLERRVLEWEQTDAVLWDPHALVGKQLRVLWPGDDRYFPGRIVKYLPTTFQHEVHYDDGDQEDLVLAVEKVQLQPACIRTLPAPSPAHLSGLARQIDSLADKLEVKAVQQRTARGRTMLKEDDRQQLELLRRRAADIRNAKDRRELMLKAEQHCAELQRQSARSSHLRQHVNDEPNGAHTPGKLAAIVPLARTQRAAAVSAAAAIGATAQVRASSVGQQSVAGAIESASHRTTDSQQRSTNDLRAGTGKLLEQGQRQDHKAEPRDTPVRVCSPAAAKRRQHMRCQLQKQKLGVREAPHVIAVGVEARNSVSLGLSPFSSAHLASAVDEPQAGQQHQQVALPAQATNAPGWGPSSRGTRGGMGANVDTGRLYIPRPWPALRAASVTAAGAPEAMDGTAEPTTLGIDKQQQGCVVGAAAGVDAKEEPGAIQKQPQQQSEAAGDGIAPAVAMGPGDDDKGGEGAGTSGRDERHRAATVAAELREAYKHFRRHCSGFKQYHEIQVGLWLSPQQLVGREIRVMWPDEDAWFCGRVTRYDADAGTHTVEYDDGDVEHLHLAAEEVRLQLVPGEAEHGLAPRPPAELQQVAACLAANAARLQQRAQRKRAGKQGQAQEDDEDPDELMTKAERWHTRAAQLQALAAAMLREAASKPAASNTGRQQLVATPGAGKAEAAAVGLGDQAGSESAGGGRGMPTARADDNTSAAVAVDAMHREPLPQQPGCADGEGGAPGFSGAGEEVPLAPDWATTQVLQPGEVVWAQVRRSAPWPAIIITREEAEREGLSVSRQGGSSSSTGQFACVRFFGDHTVCGLPTVAAGQRIPDRGGALPFLAGLDLGWHERRSSHTPAGAAPGGSTAQAQRFLRALFELRTYMMDGELPRGMIPPNYDDDDDEEGEVGDQGPDAAVDSTRRGGRMAGARSDAGSAPTALTTGSVNFPFPLGPKLRVLRLGEVVWLSRWFHDEKYIYPLGYTAARLMASGASGGREVQHVMEVAASEDGVRPVFRITPDGGHPVSADTATRAMRALFQDDARASGRAFAKTGADLFGLSSARVAALVRALPGAERCERFANWSDQDKPPLPSLTPYEELQRHALYARSLRLPPGVEAIPQAKAGMCFECDVCGEDEESLDDLKLECDKCRCVVHSRCYGVQQPTHAGLWLCDVCQLHAAGLPADLPPPCELCPVVGGPMKRNDAGGYVHLLCAVWTPGVTFGNPETLEPVEGVAKAIQNRSSLRCFLCKQAHGACIQCNGDARCYTAFHPMCAREAGMAMCERRQAAAARGQRVCGPAVGGQHHAAGAGSRPPADDSETADPEQEEGKENKQAIANAALIAVVCGTATAVVYDALGNDKDGGEATGTGIKAALVLPGHRPGKQGTASGGVGGSVPASVPDAAATAAATAVALQRRRGGRSRHSGLAAALDRGACRGGVSLGNGISLVCFCPRHEDLVLHQPQFRISYPGGRFANRRAELTREQLRARRQQLLQEHELNQGPQQQQPQQQGQQREGGMQDGRPPSVEATSGRAMSFADWRSRGHRAPEAVAIAREKRTFVRQLPYLVTGRLQQDEQAVRAVRARCTRPRGQGAGTDRGVAGAGAVADAGRGEASSYGAIVAAARSSGHRASGTLPAPLAAAAAASGARSVAERYAAMRATVGQRLATGKSAIHGWGAFAKVPHKRGDMLIEYAGELIRPSVSDVREKRVYDKLVGCGTYIFNLNESQHIDATQAGNMAHLLNHSCDPNCYSRTITLWDSATAATTDHVIITAKRDIEAWEELTYDYRFNSAVDLPCNCGAATCRLLVNWPEQPQEEGDEEGEGQEEMDQETGDGDGEQWQGAGGRVEDVAAV